MCICTVSFSLVSILNYYTKVQNGNQYTSKKNFETYTITYCDYTQNHSQKNVQSGKNGIEYVKIVDKAAPTN